MPGLDYPTATASEMAAAVRAGEVSAVELTKTAIAEIEARDGPINAVVVRDFARALEDAQGADARRAAGGVAPLLGVPMTVKESWDLEGWPTTWGVAGSEDHRADFDAVAVERLKAAGAIILGKTNVPPWLADWQSENPLYGRTNNPHDLTRSAGGSSGGSAAAVAAGMVPLELGSDIGGSIRVPAAFCGVFGHKPSHRLVPLTGHGHAGARPAHPELSVGGPLARCAADLDLALSVVAGPDGDAAKGYLLDLPPPRHAHLKDYRVLVIARHPRAAVSSAVAGAMEQLGADLARQGAEVLWECEVLPDLDRDHRAYVKMLTTILSRRTAQDGRPTVSAHAWMDMIDQQDAIRREWAALFEEVDAVITPAFGTAAFPHTAEPQWRERRLSIDGEDAAFGDQLVWPSLATYPLLPATAFPLGRDGEGLPIGGQIVGGFAEDRTTIALAGMIGSRL